MNRIVITLALILSMPDLYAQQKLTIGECRKLALENSEEMQIARLRVEKAKAEKAAMMTLYLPSLSGSATGVYLFEDIEQELTLPTLVPDLATGELRPNVMVNPLTGEMVVGADGNPVFNLYAWLPLEISLKGAYLAGISLQQPLYTGGRIAAGNAMTKIGVAMAGDNLELQRASILYEADQIFWLYVSVQEKVKLAGAYAELLSRLETRVRDAWETGMTTRNELLKVAVKHNEARLQWEKARSGLELTRMALCRITGLPFDTAIETVADDPGEDTGGRGSAGNTALSHEQVPEDPAGQVSGVSASLQARPEYRLLLKNVDLAAQQVKLARAEFLPTAGVSVGYNYVGGIDIGPEKFTSSNPTVMASLKVPIFHWGEGRQKQLAARLEQDIRKAELEKNSRLMTLEMEQARLNLLDSRMRVEMAEQALIQADENLRVNNDNYEVGMVLLTDLLEAQAEWQNARSENIEAKVELKLNESAWRKATGKPE